MNKSFRKLWSEAGYGDVMGSAEVVPPPPAHLIRAYHILPADHAINDIGLGRLKVARYADLNDPFELLAPNLKDEALRKAATKFKKMLDEEIGLLCFSRDWTNPVLWSHYGAKHHGICLGFNVTRTRASPVKYEEARINFNPSEDKFRKGADWLDTKFKHWEYEQELRVTMPLADITKEGSLHFCPFDDGLELAEVILGARCTYSLDAVRRLVSERYSKVASYKARVAFGHFKIVPDARTVP